jgi:hypothetical protein
MQATFVNSGAPGPLKPGDRLAYEVRLRDVGTGALFIVVTLGRTGEATASSTLPTTFGLSNTGGEGEVREVYGYVPAVQSGEHRVTSVDLTLNGQSQACLLGINLGR